MADVKISELPVASTVSDSDIVVINQGGTTKTATRGLVKGTSSSSYSVNIPGSGNWLTAAPTIGIATGDYTIEMFVNISAYDPTGADMAVFFDARGAGSNTSEGPLFYVSPEAGHLRLYSNGVVAAEGTGVLPIPTSGWHHIAAVRESSAITLYIDGNSVASGTDSTNWVSSQLYINAIEADTTLNANMKMASLRISSVARYSGATYTVPTAAFVADGNTVYLLLQSLTLDGLFTPHGTITMVEGPFASTGYVPVTRTITAGTGLSGGGDLSADRTISLSVPVSVANGGTGVTASSGASSVVLRDASQNISVNSAIEGFTSLAASVTPLVLTVTSAPSYLVTGSGGQTIKLPDATTLQNGVVFLFNNNQSSGAISVNNNSNTLVASIPSGGFTAVSLLSNSIAAGSWERHEQAPSNVTWSTSTLDYPGSITSATWNGNAVAVNRGGTGATTAQAAISSLGVGMRMIEAQTSSNVVGTMNTGVSPNTFTVTATGVFSADGYTPVLGDIIAFTLQGTLTQNGFWEVTTVGAVGVQAVFTRPAWFTGTVRNGMYMTRFGASQSAYVMSFFNNTQNADITIGTSSINVFRVSYRAQTATTGSNSFSGRQIFFANSTTNAPFQFQAGAALMTTPVAHYVEWFNDIMYLTTSAGVRMANVVNTVVPATATSAGLVGQIAVDNAGSWLYVCTAANVWKRVLLTTF